MKFYPNIGELVLILQNILHIAPGSLINCLLINFFDQTCVLSGSLAKLFSDYQDKVEFLCVYMAEAHPKEMWNFGPRFCFMEAHKTIDDRIQAAR